MQYEDTGAKESGTCWKSPHPVMHEAAQEFLPTPSHACLRRVERKELTRTDILDKEKMGILNAPG